MSKRGFAILRYIQDFQNGRLGIDSLPFDKILMFIYNKEGGKYIKIFDVQDPRSSAQRLKAILLRLLPTDEEDVRKIEEEEIVHNVAAEEKNVEKNSLIRNSVRDYIKTFNMNPTSSFKELKNTSILYNALGNHSLAMNMAKKLSALSPEKEEKVIDNVSKNIIPKMELKNIATNPYIKWAKPEELLDNQNPVHLLEKRKIDFTTNLENDIIDAFKTLEKKDIFFKVTGIKSSVVKDSASELKQTIRQRFFVDLKDDRGVKHQVRIDLPKLTENGTFVVNGQHKVLVNQMVTYPIFFHKEYYGRFQSSYSTLQINSKKLKTGAYLILFMATFKVPIIMYLAYRIGFDAACKLFDITYRVTDKKEVGSILLPNKKYITFDIDTELKSQFVESFEKSIPFANREMFDLFEPKSWKLILENYLGNRNCTHIMDTIWDNIVTPVEVKILGSRGEPTTLAEILKYICERVVEGKVDDHNDLHKARIRTSELFVALLQKQIYAAYSEYLSKRLGGDENAELYINPTKIFSVVINSQNVQPLENINPIEELSMMTRLSPIAKCC
jgi:hypothetical protein